MTTVASRRAAMAIDSLVSKSVAGRSCALPFGFAALAFFRKAAFALGGARARRHAAARPVQRGAQYIGEALDHLGAIALAVAVAVAAKDQFAAFGEAIGESTRGEGAIGVGQRPTPGEIETQHDLGLDLIHILSSRTAGAREGQFDFVVWDAHPLCDLDR